MTMLRNVAAGLLVIITLIATDLRNTSRASAQVTRSEQDGGAEVRMFKRLTQWHVRPGVEREIAVRHWTGEHVRLVERVPHLRGYVQDVAVVGPDGAEPPYAGLGEAWFATLDEAQAATKSSEWAAVLEDARTFMDFERLVVAWAKENVALPPSTERLET